MSKIAWKGGTMLAPLPVVLVSCADNGKSNVMTAAWTGIINSNPPMTYVSIRPERLSHSMIENSREFCINMPSSDLCRIVDFCGIKSGRDCEKLQSLSITAAPSEAVSCPSVAECPVTLECKVTEIKKLGSHDMFIAEIVAVTVDESLVDENGKLRLEKASLMTYAHGNYHTVGKKIGSFGFSVRKKRAKK